MYPLKDCGKISCWRQLDLGFTQRSRGKCASMSTVDIGYCDYHLVTNIGYCDYFVLHFSA